MSLFDDRPLYTRPLVGIRSWRVHADMGWLYGIVHPQRWLPGVNEAKCGKANRLPCVCNTCEPEKAPPKHRVASLGCSCGFYAYFDTEQNTHHRDCCVVGLIKGWGLMSVGERGFRCEKAQILALIDGDVPWREPSAWDFLTFRGRDYRIPSRVPDLVRDHYPVPVFSDWRAALAEFPLTPIPRERPLPGPGRVSSAD